MEKTKESIEAALKATGKWLEQDKSKRVARAALVIFASEHPNINVLLEFLDLVVAADSPPTVKGS